MTAATAPQLLIVDPDQRTRAIAAAVAASLGFEAAEADCGRAALSLLAKAMPHAVLLEPQLPDAFGYALLSNWRTAAPDLQVAIMSPDGSFDSVLQAMRQGACDYLPKPFESVQLRLLLQRIQQRLSSNLDAISEHPSALNGLHDLTCLSEIERATIERVFHQVNGDKAMAGKLLGISRATLYRKLKRYQIGGSGNRSPHQQPQL